jgi:hypothetical protein
MIRKWSVGVWPVVFGAMSDSTKSAGPSIRACGHIRVIKIALYQLGPRHSVDRQQVHPDDLGGPALHGHLAPATGRRAQIDDPAALGDEVEFVVQFDQLERRTGAVALRSRGHDIGIVQLAAQPELLAGGAASRCTEVYGLAPRASGLFRWHPA